MLPKCPVCGGKMVVTELRCEKDDVTVRGKFEASIFDFLDEEDYEFLILFLRAKGNLKELERYTGQGYFALRGRLERILQKLGLEPLEREAKNEDIFDMVRKGKISVDEALRILKRRDEE